ncbi:MAG: hypothetical protein IKE53_09950 [Clostridiales bacterium]|nr:hypothetical protein [Clostridiales bacterium]
MTSRKHRLISVLLSFSLLLVSCGKNTDVTSFRNVDDENTSYETDQSASLSTDYIFGIVYTDPSCYRFYDGKNQVCFNRCHGVPVIMSYEEITSLDVGEKIKIDRDRSVSVDYMNIDLDWQPQTLDFEGYYYGALPGRIDISDEYYFTHLCYNLHPDGSESFNYDLEEELQDKELWELHDHNEHLRNAMGELGLILKHDDLQWIPLSEGCSIVIDNTDGSFSYDVEISDLQDKLAEYRENDGIMWCSASADLNENGEIYALQIHIFENN